MEKPDEAQPWFVDPAPPQFYGETAPSGFVAMWRETMQPQPATAPGVELLCAYNRVPTDKEVAELLAHYGPVYLGQSPEIGEPPNWWERLMGDWQVFRLKLENRWYSLLRFMAGRN